MGPLNNPICNLGVPVSPTCFQPRTPEWNASIAWRAWGPAPSKGGGTPDLHLLTWNLFVDLEAHFLTKIWQLKNWGQNLWPSALPSTCSRFENTYSNSQALWTHVGLVKQVINFKDEQKSNGIQHDVGDITSVSTRHKGPIPFDWFIKHDQMPKSEVPSYQVALPQSNIAMEIPMT